MRSWRAKLWKTKTCKHKEEPIQSTYKQYGKETCSAHYIRESQIAAVILDDLKRVTHFARRDETLFAEYINRKNTADTGKEITALQKELEVMRKRDLELTALDV